MLRRTDQSLDTPRTSSTKPSCANRRMQRRGAYGFAMEAEERLQPMWPLSRAWKEETRVGTSMAMRCRSGNSLRESGASRKPPTVTWLDYVEIFVKSSLEFWSLWNLH
ncbi:unnamed protein product [Brassica napus]|uniref:(rape) hypothetical protein n=1 Tax=Brassica napus TaxID=3708 RepID=A0A816J0T5_BRANA|nr:unnamed protein product [Brassica napus]